MPIPSGSFLQNFMKSKKTDGVSEPEVKKTLNPFGENAMDRLTSIGSFAQNASDLTKMNGRERFDTGEVSQGAQELDQKVQQNEMSGLQQRTANFLQNMNPYNSMYPGSPDNPMDPMGVPLVPGPGGGLINKGVMDVTGGDPDEIQRRKEILQQNPAGNPYSFMR